MVGGDKRNDWTGWYETNIPIADDRFDEHQARLAAKRSEVNARSTKGTKTETKEEETSLTPWEKKVLEAPGAPERVQEIEDEVRLAADLAPRREQARLTQRELAERIGGSQPRIAAIERS